jgi:hypothetical protein
MQSGGGIVDTGNQQAVDGDNQRAQWSTYMRSTGLLWKESGYKVAWSERVCQYLRLSRISRLDHPRRTIHLQISEQHSS